MSDYACALIVRNAELLLGRRAPHRKSYANTWDVIGGKVETGEDFETALRRELREEIGISPVRFRPYATLRDRNGRDDGVQHYHYFLVTAWQGTPAICNHEHTELRWFPHAGAAALPDLALPAYRDMFARLPFDPARA